MSNQKNLLHRGDIEAQARGVAASQATTIEQSRAEAQVKAAAIMAKQAPRDKFAARAAILEACKDRELADRAFFEFKRGGGPVSGPTIHLATEIALLWGNIEHGIDELERNDDKGVSEMVAFAWDMETNTRHRMSFISPHRRDTKHGPKTLVDMRDIYENNANMGARRLRECIFRVVPASIRHAAEAECRNTLNRQDSDKPLVERIAAMVSYLDGLGITRAQIEEKVGKNINDLTPENLANLKITIQSMKRNEISRDEAFPSLAADDLKKELSSQDATGEASTQDSPQGLPSSTAAKASGEKDKGGAASSDRPIEDGGATSSPGATKKEPTVQALIEEMDTAPYGALAAKVYEREAEWINLNTSPEERKQLEDAIARAEERGAEND